MENAVEYNITVPVITMKVKPLVTELENKWLVSLEYDTTIYEASKELLSQHAWAKATLESWDGVKQVSWSQWEFDSETVADAFVILYMLNWKKD